jgi:hypothetical protein
VSTVAVDFDGVVHAYSKGWQNGAIYDGPVPGAIDAIKSLQQHYAVFVHTTRDPEPVTEWLRGHDINATAEKSGEYHEFWNDKNWVLVTNRKLPAVAYIDDRAIRFTSWPQALADLQEHEPPRK